MAGKSKIIAVIGGSQPSARELKLAEEVGAKLAEHGVILVCGGMGGIMEAACRGAQSNGGLTIGILPGDSAREANACIQVPIVTGMGYARNVIVVKSARAAIAIGGSYGTLTEIGYALHSGIPVIGLGTWSLFRNGKEDKGIIQADDAADAVAKALALIV